MFVDIQNFTKDVPQKINISGNIFNLKAYFIEFHLFRKYFSKKLSKKHCVILAG